ncbi:MAG: Jag N-terminal domain-containing protein [Chloroflexia bacterium]|nr:Jag N-terminal domain-containing protein [Chloroflexia bacterium]
MKKGITIRARTVDEAIRLALEHLEMEQDEVDVEVLEQGQLNIEEALVRVVPKGAAPAVEEKVSAAVEAVKVAEQDEELDPLRLGEKLLSELLQHMGFRAEVSGGEYSVTPGENQLILDITTPNERNSGLLIGRRGDTLHQLQFLVNLMVSRQLRRWPYLLVDVEHYRRRRDDTLLDLAHRMAERVGQSGQPLKLEPMSAYERRIVHLALRDNEQVVTQSTGEGDDRKVVIYPAGWELPTF